MQIASLLNLRCMQLEESSDLLCMHTMSIFMMAGLMKI